MCPSVVCTYTMSPANCKPKLYAHGREQKDSYTYVPSFTLNSLSKQGTIAVYKVIYASIALNPTQE